MVPLPSAGVQDVALENQMTKKLAFTALLGTYFLLVGCSEDVRFLNGAPAVTQLGPVAPVAEGTVEVAVVLADFEGDPVDLVVEWVTPGGELETATVAPGIGHGIVGLTSSLNDGGTLHRVVLNAPSQSEEELRLRATPSDREGGVGETLETPLYNPETGYPEAVLLQ